MMSDKPTYLRGIGRGRGSGFQRPGGNRTRGIGRGAGFSDSTNYNQQPSKGMPFSASSNYADSSQTRQPTPWGKGSMQNNAASPDIKSQRKSQHNGGLDSASVKFAAISSSHQEVIKKYLETDPILEDSEEEDIEVDVLQTIFKSYSSNFESTESVSVAQEDLLHSFRSGTSACLICIEAVKKQDAIWNCQGCYGMFHMQCIQKWVKEGVYQQVYASGDDNVDSRSIPWYCPKCRAEYKQNEAPNRYYCFCGREQDPKFDPWLVPHSCGQTCGRELKPVCGHQCLLLCHPGPCPPCPKTVRSTCHCEKQKPQIQRCSSQTWSCGQVCGKLLSCQQHCCEQICHQGECRPCKKISQQKCLCGKEMALRPCASPQWQCQKPCNKALLCGHHNCEQVCHDGKCGECPRTGSRRCPCGKTAYDLPCTEDVPPCGDTCDKELDCGMHTCLQRCHSGPCGTCRQIVLKTCRCQQRKKEVLCCKEYLCDLKCSNTRDCGKHQCKRKCCDGNCPSCEQMCGKLLSCRNHKCQSRCHRGRCYPCPLTVDILCNCKFTSITVPCGKEKSIKPPRCHQKCKNPPACHHARRGSHRCHFGDCPPCMQICSKKQEKCDHTCPSICHTALKVKVKENVRRAGPWESAPVVREEIVDRPCPPCAYPMPMQCLGEHETTNMPCAELRPYSCHKKCGRLLPCGNHSCSLNCHKVENAKDEFTAGIGCESCESQCLQPRPQGCSHQCLLTCHPGNCPPCKQMIRMRCHCKVVVCHVPCHVWNSISPKEQSHKQSCGGSCPKNLPCGHKCGSVCHAGECTKPEKCDQRVKVKCKCKRKKKEFVCKDVQSGKALVECDDFCESEKARKQKIEEEADIERKEKEQKKQQAELEEYERKFKGRKRKPKKQRGGVEDSGFWERYRFSMILSFLISVVIGLIIFLIQNSNST